MTKVKICGVTNYEDAANAAILGADFIGFNFYALSPRFIDKDDAKRIIGKIPKNVKNVGVFVNEKAEEVKKIAEDAGLDMVQLHGDETPEYCRQIKNEADIEVIKSFRINKKEDTEKIKDYDTDYYLFDSCHEGLFGGTGKAFDWNLLKSIKKKFFLSGGLNCSNVKDAIKTAHPFAVDAASGIEKNPRKKDIAKIKEFIEAAK